MFVPWEMFPTSPANLSLYYGWLIWTLQHTLPFYQELVLMTHCEWVLLLGNALLQGSTGVCPGDDLLHVPREILVYLVKLGTVWCLHVCCLVHSLSPSENVKHAQNMCSTVFYFASMCLDMRVACLRKVLAGRRVVSRVFTKSSVQNKIFCPRTCGKAWSWDGCTNASVFIVLLQNTVLYWNNSRDATSFFLHVKQNTCKHAKAWLLLNKN